MLELKELQFEFEDNKPVIKNLSLQMKPRDIVWLQGENGSGKTTLLLIIAQLLEAKGKILYKDKVLSRKDFLQHVTYIPSDPYLFDYLTGKENAQFTQSLFSTPKYEFDVTFQLLMTKFNLTDSLNQLVQEYSLGMRSKLFLGAMFSRRSTAIYLLDEPVSALDKEGKDVLMKLLLEKQSQGAIIIFTSHIEKFGTDIATKTYKLEKGTLLASEERREDNGT